jgi:hypothetical protein
MQTTIETTGLAKRGRGRPRGNGLTPFTMHMKIPHKAYLEIRKAAEDECLAVAMWARRTMILAARKQKKSA